MNVYRVVTTRKNHKGEPIYFNLECALPSIEAIFNHLNEGKLLFGHALYTKFSRDEQGKFFEVVDSKPIILGIGTIASIELPNERFIRFETDGVGDV